MKQNLGKKVFLLTLLMPICFQPSSISAQETTTEIEVIVEEKAPSEDDLQVTGDDNEINTAEPINQTESLLSLKGGQKLMQEAEKAIAEENYDLAVTKLQQARRIFNQLSNFYLQLADSFSGINNRISEEQRSGALKTATFRDEATYQLSLVHRAQNKPELAVPLLIQIIRSQNPTSDLGKKSYQQLYEIGFVEEPFQTSSN